MTLDPTRRYRFIVSGVASTLVGQVYDYSDLTTPLVTISADDSSYPGGVLGVFDFSRVGAADYTNPTTGKADVTFDNYYASTNGPVPVGLQGTPHPVPGMPQVADRSPDARANFYAYTNGIAFTATTLTTNAINTNSVKLYLNGADVSSGLELSGTASNLDVAFSGLAPNTVYDSRIVLSDFAGRTSTNEFTFDTFEEDYFESPAVKVIEAEDYNYGGGQFQDNRLRPAWTIWARKSMGTGLVTSTSSARPELITSTAPLRSAAAPSIARPIWSAPRQGRRMKSRLPPPP